MNLIPWQKSYILESFLFPVWERNGHFAKQDATLSCAKVCYANSRLRRGVTDTHKVSESTWPARASSRRVRASGTTASQRQNEARPLRHVRHGEFSRPVVPDGHSRLPVALRRVISFERDGMPQQFAAKQIIRKLGGEKNCKRLRDLWS